MRAEQVANVSIRDVKFAAMDVLHNLQRRSPQTQLAGIGWLFLLACRRYNVDPREALRVVDAMIRRALDIAPMYPRAIAEYMKNEWPGD